jgi:tetratricopeptide (TPR) repeat protein
MAKVAEQKPKGADLRKESVLYGIIGLLVGVMIGYIGTQTINCNYAGAPGGPVAGGAQSPGVPGGAAGGAQGQGAAGPPPAVMEAISKARNEPSNFDAQMQAAELYLQIERYENALEFLTRAERLKPRDVAVLSRLGDVNLVLGRAPEAEKWYRQALQTDPRHERTLQNLTLALIDKGDAAAARATVSQLEKINPNHPSLPDLKAKLGKG